jgi:hypothetical protein
VLATLGFCLLFALATVAVRTWSAWQGHVDAMADELRLIDQVFQRSLAKAIWEMDREALDTHLASAAQAASVGRVRLGVRQADGSMQPRERTRPGWSPSARMPSLRCTTSPMQAPARWSASCSWMATNVCSGPACMARSCPSC